MAADLSKQEKAIKAIKDLLEVIGLWASGKITHESAMLQVQAIVKGASK